MIINKFTSYHFLFLCFSLIAYTPAVTTHNEGNVLFSEYQRYSALLNEQHKYTPKQLNNVFSFFTDRKQKDLLNTEAKTDALLKELVTDYLSFPLWINKSVGHFENMDNNSSCLVINGYTTKNEPIAINVNYSKSPHWKIEEVHVEFLAPFNKFLTKAICDRKIRDAIRLKEMM